jgi:hypothetical protein
MFPRRSGSREKEEEEEKRLLFSVTITRQKEIDVCMALAAWCFLI